MESPRWPYTQYGSIAVHILLHLLFQYHPLQGVFQLDRTPDYIFPAFKLSCQHPTREHGRYHLHEVWHINFRNLFAEVLREPLLWNVDQFPFLARGFLNGLVNIYSVVVSGTM